MTSTKNKWTAEEIINHFCYEFGIDPDNFDEYKQDPVFLSEDYVEKAIHNIHSRVSCNPKMLCWKIELLKELGLSKQEEKK